MKRMAVLAFVALGLATGCSEPEKPSTPVPTTPAAKVTRQSFVPVASATSGTTAFGYDPALVAAGATAELGLTPAGDKTEVRLSVTGLVPNRAYGAHLHVKVCGSDPKAAGAHFQHHLDPVATQAPSTDPAFANPANEVWLDFQTDASGKATAKSTATWVLTSTVRPASLVIHAETTKTEAGKAGTAGARAACMTIAY